MRIVAVVVALGAALVLPASACWACSCAPGDSAQYWEGADAVFDGFPIDRTEPDANGMITWTFEVVDAWKGDVAPAQQVRSHQHGATCGITFELGVTYRVYAIESPDGLNAWLCSGTAARDTYPDGPPAEAATETPTQDPTRTPTQAPTSAGTPTEGAPNGDGTPPTVVTPEQPPADPTTQVSDDPTFTSGDQVDVGAPGGGSAAAAVGAGAAGVGLLGLAVWLVRRTAPT